MATFKGNLLPSQKEFVLDTEPREIAFVGGYGAGKTLSAACKALYLASKNQGYAGMIASPTHAMLVDTFIPTFEEVLQTKKIRYTFRASPNPMFTLHFPKGKSKIYCRSAENYRRMASLNLSWAVVDEADLIDRWVGHKMVKMIQSRIRTGNERQIAYTTTPEGYNLMYDLFVKDKKPYKRIIHAKTTENPFLPEEYIQSLYDSYSPQEVEAYVNGFFTNMKTGSVYPFFERTQHHTDMTVEDFCRYGEKGGLLARPILHVGCDFNAGQTVGIVCVISEGVVYVVDEFVELRDTQELIEVLKHRYGEYTIKMYPDSSGKARSTATTETDISQLREAFGRGNVKFNNKNPRILNRVKSVNAMMMNANREIRLYINTEHCPTLTSGIERQAYDPKTSLPEKKWDMDHPIDALGYFIWKAFPAIGKPSARNI